MWGTDMPYNYTCNLNNERHDFNWKNYCLEAHTQILDTLPKDMREAAETQNVERFLYG